MLNIDLQKQKTKQLNNKMGSKWKQTFSKKL